MALRSTTSRNIGRFVKPNATTRNPHTSLERNTARPNATSCDTAQPILENEKRTHSAYETWGRSQVCRSHAGSFCLTPRHLAAARLLASGLSISIVARRLGICRATLWRWQQHPPFAQELRRLHERLSEQIAVVATVTKAAGASPKPRVAISDDEIVEQLLRM